MAPERIRAIPAEAFADSLPGFLSTGEATKRAPIWRGWNPGIADRDHVGVVACGVHNISLSNIVKLAQRLKIDPGELVKGLPAAEMVAN